jgi:uncharacterized RDD family membrane protein YckC
MQERFGSADDPHAPPPRGFASRMVEALVNPIVSPLVNAVDVAGVVERVDVEDVVERIDVDALLDRIDIDRLLDRIDVNRLLDRVEADDLLDRVDADRLLDRVDVDRLLNRIRVDPLLDRIEVDRLLDRIDVDRLLDRVDLDRLLDRMDVSAVADRIDVNALVDRTELGAIVARSTTGVFGQLLDSARGVAMLVDLVVQTSIRRALRPGQPHQPGRPDAPDEIVDARSMSQSERTQALQGHHAGSVSRFLAFLADQFTLGLIFATGQALVSLALEVITGVSWEPADHRWAVAFLFSVWWFVYFALPLAVTGRTIGMAFVGVRVVRADGARLEARRAAARTAVFPLSFLLLGIGFLIGLVRRDRRELHDLIARTAVIYSWDAEIAAMRAVSSTSPG